MKFAGIPVHEPQPIALGVDRDAQHGAQAGIVDDAGDVARSVDRVHGAFTERADQESIALAIVFDRLGIEGRLANDERVVRRDERDARGLPASKPWNTSTFTPVKKCGR